MLYMVIEHFKGNAAAIYERFREKGRMMPDGVHYVDSWIEQNYDRCFQIMETEDPALFDEWFANWNDLVDFEVVPVISSKEARDKILF